MRALFMVKYFLILTLVLSFSTSFAKKKKHASVQNLSGVVESCHDGDTCRVLVNGKSLKIRFAGIDTPELSQKYGKKPKASLKLLLRSKLSSLNVKEKVLIDSLAPSLKPGSISMLKLSEKGGPMIPPNIPKESSRVLPVRRKVRGSGFGRRRVW